jgi:membrane-associated phospholipid phosphatase
MPSGFIENNLFFLAYDQKELKESVEGRLSCAGVVWIVTTGFDRGCSAEAGMTLIRGLSWDLAIRAPRRVRHLLIPPANDASPTLWRRFSFFPFVFIPWLILYEFVVHLGPQPGSFETYLPGEVNWPIWQWTEILYVSPYFLVTLAPFVVTTNRALRRFILAAWIMTAIIDFIFLSVPAIAPFRPFHPTGILGQMMLEDRWADLNNGTAAFPSFHVVWSFLGALAWSSRMPRWKWLWLAWAAAVSASCIFTGMHSLLDVIAGFCVFLFVCQFDVIGERIGQRRRRARRRRPVS